MVFKSVYLYSMGTIKCTDTLPGPLRLVRSWYLAIIWGQVLMFWNELSLKQLQV